MLAGRTSDTSIFACVPLRMGSNRGLTWHAAKILECGATCAVSRKRSDGVFGWIRDDHVTIDPLDPEMRCTPQSVASHTLYENADPFHITEPGGILDTTGSNFANEDNRSVSVQGSAYHMADRYSVKLEGAELAGYQSIIVGGVRDPYIISQIDSWPDGMREGFAGRAKKILGSSDGNQDYRLIIRVYVCDAVMGPLEPLRETPHEVACCSR